MFVVSKARRNLLVALATPWFLGLGYVVYVALMILTQLFGDQIGVDATPLKESLLKRGGIYEGLVLMQNWILTSQAHIWVLGFLLISYPVLLLPLLRYSHRADLLEVINHHIDANPSLAKVGGTYLTCESGKNGHVEKEVMFVGDDRFVVMSSVNERYGETAKEYSSFRISKNRFSSKDGVSVSDMRRLSLLVSGYADKRVRSFILREEPF